MGAAKTLGVARLGSVDYEAALELQEALVRMRQQESVGDLLLLLEHPHVYTLGRGADERYLKAVPAGVPVFRVSRGGQVTYHGPGQLVGYPILKLEGSARDVHGYLRRLEQAVIEALGDVGLKGERRAGLTGVWVGARKIASIGVGIRRWITLHGFALNVCPDLGFFEAVVPCGIEGCVMTSIAAEGRSDVTTGEFAEPISNRFAKVFGYSGTARIEAADLRRLIDRHAPACEARSQ